MSKGSVVKTGDWAIARDILRFGPTKFNAAVDVALLQEAQWFRKKVVRGITRQNPGGKRFKKLTPSTLRTRKAKGFRGSKALLRTGELRNSITIIKRSQGVFMGIPRSARGKDGRSLIRLGQIHEFGTRPVAIRMTPAMQRFLAATLRGSRHASTGNASGTGIVIVQIPARPFLTPVMEKHGKPGPTVVRMRKRLAVILHGKFGA